MSALLKYEQPVAREIVDHGFAADEISFLNQLRLTAMRCRSSARLDMFEACRLVMNEGAQNHDIVIEALLRTMYQGLNKTPAFLSPNSEELSFDESWLLRCVCGLRDKDYGSVRFLIARRVAQPYQRSMAFLIEKVSECLTQV